MELSAPLKKYVSECFSVSAERTLDKYLDLNNIVNEINAEGVTWEPYFATSVYAWCATTDVSHPQLNIDTTFEITDGDKSEIVSRISTVLSKLAKITSEVSRVAIIGKYDEEICRSLFHMKLACGCVCLLKGDTQTAFSLLAEVSETPYNRQLRRTDTWNIIKAFWINQKTNHNVPLTLDVVLGKQIVFYEFFMQYIRSLNLYDLIHVGVNASKGSPWPPLCETFERVFLLWEAILKSEDESIRNSCRKLIELGSPLDWVSLIDSIGYLIIHTSDDLTPLEPLTNERNVPDHPNECAITSTAYWSWFYGKTVASLWKNETSDSVTSMVEQSNPGVYVDQWREGMTLLSLLAECSTDRNWVKALEIYLKGWRNTYGRSVHQLYMEAPNSEIFWAMRIGLADGFLESVVAQKSETNSDIITGSKLNPVASRDLEEVLRMSSMPLSESLMTHFVDIKEMLYSIKQGQDEMSRDIQQTPRLERIEFELRENYGDWINCLTNQGALINAEFLFDSLGKKSWGEVTLGYCNAFEAEIRKIIERLRNVAVRLMQNPAFKLKDTKILTILRSSVDRLSLYEIEAVLSLPDNAPIITELAREIQVDSFFITSTLPNVIRQLRELRKPSAHGGITEKEAAKRARKLVLGTTKDPGILKKLADTNIEKQKYTTS